MEDVLAKIVALCSQLEDLLAELQQLAEKRPNPYAKLRETYPNAGKPWTAAADDELRRLWSEGKPIESLAMQFGRTANGVRQRLERLGVPVSEIAAARP